MYYIKFGEDGIQEESRLAEESPGEGWHPAGEDISGKLFRLVNGAAAPMTKKMIEDYESGLRKKALIFDSRLKRNRALTESDWTQLASSPLSDEKKIEWETYRQALRDFPSALENDPELQFPAEPQ